MTRFSDFRSIACQNKMRFHLAMLGRGRLETQRLASFPMPKPPLLQPIMHLATPQFHTARRSGVFSSRTARTQFPYHDLLAPLASIHLRFITLSLSVAPFFL
jgi:hypothetical protein